MKARVFAAATLLLTLTRASVAQDPTAAGAAEVYQRIATIREWGAVDVIAWPDSEAVLIYALRADPVESVRYEAAMALAQGHCCTTKTLAALYVCATGSDLDGGIEESSVRVKAAATHALSVAVCRLAAAPCKSTPPTLHQPPSGIQLTTFYVEDLPRCAESQIIEHVYRLLAETLSSQTAPETIADHGSSVSECQCPPPGPVPLASRHVIPWPMWPTTPMRTLGPPW